MNMGGGIWKTLLVVVCFVYSSASSALDPITAMCFKVMANAEVCGCATAKLAEQAGAQDYEIYESIVARTLSQTNVPRSRAWDDALNAEASARALTLQVLTDKTAATGTVHNVALNACVDAQARK